MKAAIIAGKCDGCGVSTYLFELQKAFNKYAGTCDYYVYDCPSFFKENDYNLMKKLNVKTITRANAAKINNYDIVFAAYHVVRSQVTEDEANGYYDMLEYDITNPLKVLIFNEHRPSSIIKHYANGTIDKYCLRPSFLLSFDKIMQFGSNITTAVFLKDLIGEAEYMKRFTPLYHLYEFNNIDNWVPAAAKIKAIEYLGRAALFKDAHRLIRANDKLQKAGYIVEMRGLGYKETLENLPDFVYESDGKYGVDRTKKSSITYWISPNEDQYKLLDLPIEKRNNKIYCYGNYNKYEIYNHLNRVAYACDFFNLPHVEDYADSLMEYCMCEFIDNGIIPILDNNFGSNSNIIVDGKISNTKFNETCAGIFLNKDLSNIDEVIEKMDYLYNNPIEYDKFRKESLEIWKEHCNPKNIIENLLENIYK